MNAVLEWPLTTAQVQAGINHFRDRVGGPRRLACLVVAIVLVLALFDVFSYSSLSNLLGDALRDSRVEPVIMPMLPVVLSMSSFAISLVVAMVMPLQSPLALHARIAGVSRWKCGTAEFAPFAVMTMVLTVGTQLGSILFLVGYSASRGASFVALLLLDFVFALLCPVVVLSVQRALAVVRVPGYESRWLAVLAAGGFAGAALLDVLRWASDVSTSEGSGSVLKGISMAWGGGLPDTPGACLVLSAMIILLLIAGSLVASTDSAAGYLAPGRPFLSLPSGGGPGVQLVATELAQWLRDPTSRVSLVCTVAGDIALVWAVRSGSLDSGVALTLLILLSASGAELLVGRTRGVNWTLVVVGCKPSTIFVTRCLPVAIVMLAAFSAAVVLSGAAGSSGILFLEALSLASAVTCAAAMAGTVFPFETRAPLAMVGTTTVAFVFEIALLVVESGVLRLSGPTLIVANIGFVAIGVAVMQFFFRRMTSLGR